MLHFLDTSVLRPLMSSSQTYQAYFSKELPGDLYISAYVKMEFIRGFLINCMDFYGVLQNPKVLTISDAIHFWNNKFQPRKIKAVSTMIGDLLKSRRLNFESEGDKNRALRYIGDYIRRIFSSLESRFKTVGEYDKLCTKTFVKLKYNPNNIDETFLDYIEKFSHKRNSDSCGIRKFLSKHQDQVDALKLRKDFSVANSNSSGFQKILDNYEKVNLDEKVTCSKCYKIGDLIISLLAPTNMRLEHTDYSFDFLCGILEKSHYRHPSELTFLK